MCSVPPPCTQTVWYYPNEVYVDKELLVKARYVKADSDFGKAAQIQLFSGGFPCCLLVCLLRLCGP